LLGAAGLPFERGGDGLLGCLLFSTLIDSKKARSKLAVE
jgi:hypothetical protein